MDRFLLFGGDQYYPAGGWQDYKGSFETLTDALRGAAGNLRDTDTGTWDWWHIVDLSTNQIVEEGISGPSRKSPDQD